jgi:DNA-binding XRE family transcriptional regulator
MPATKKMSAAEKAKRKETAKQIGAEFIAGMEELIATLDAGGVDLMMKKHGIPPPPAMVMLGPPAVGPKEVKAAREALGVSQPVFALVLGTTVQAVRAWEQGKKSPTGAARRLIGEIRHDPAYWRRRFALADTTSG